MTRNAKAYRAAILHSIADPAEVGVERSYEYFEDGLLLVEGRQGRFASVTPKPCSARSARSRSSSTATR